MRDEPVLPQRKSRRVASSDTDKVVSSLINYKRRFKLVSNVLGNKNEHTISGGKKGVETRSYLSK